jgi:curved DNA-binding protein CbpA
MSLQRNYYEVLGLSPGATTDEIKRKYRELARKFHPDVVQDKVLGQRVFTQINQAYSVLGNPERRAQYNTTLQAGGSPNGTAANAAPKPNGSPAAPSQAAPTAAPTPPVSPVKSQASAEMLGRAENAIMAGKPVEARTLAVRILEGDPRHVRALEILGDALVQMGRRDEAGVQYRKALEIAPSKLIQAKLTRLTAAQPSPRTVPSAAGPAATPPPPRNGNGAGGGQRTLPPSSANTEDTEKSGGLLGRLLGRK